jgi:hypothetical protein
MAWANFRVADHTDRIRFRHVSFAGRRRAAWNGNRKFGGVSEDLARTSENQARARRVSRLYFTLGARRDNAASSAARRGAAATRFCG